MADLSEFIAAQVGPGTAKGAKVDRFLDMLPDDKRASAEAALRTVDITAGTCVRVFRRWATELGIDQNHTFNDDTVKRWRARYL